MAGIDPYDPDDYAKLRKSLKTNYLRLANFRRVRKLLVDAAAGHYYDNDSANPNRERNPVNMMDQYVQVLVRSFIQSQPIARISNKKNPRGAAMFQERVNRRIHEMDLASTLRTCLTEALLGYMGVAYCGIAASEIDPAGETFCDPVSLPEFVIDMTHSQFEHRDLVGHKFSRRIIDLIGDPNYDQDAVSQLHGDNKYTSELKDESDDDRHEKDGSIYEWVDLWSLHIKRDNIIVLMSDDKAVETPLRVESFDGPEFGPYVFLAFDKVLDKMMPNSRGALVFDQHEFVNSQYRRIMMQEDMKAEFHTYEGGSEEDARRIDNAMDGEFIHVNSNNAVKRRTKGGTDPNSLAVAIHSRQLFDESTGNIRRLGGVASSADTATEARIDSANTTRLLRDMQLQVFEFTKKIMQNIAWYEWTHPLRTEKINIKIGNNGLALDSLWSPEQREGDFVEYELDIVPDSMIHRSNGQQADELMRAMQGVVYPAMNLPSARPVVVDAPGMIKEYAELKSIPQLGKFVNYSQDDNVVSPPGGGSSALPSGAGQPQSQGVGSGGNQNDEGDFLKQVLSGAVSSGRREDEE